MSSCCDISQLLLTSPVTRAMSNGMYTGFASRKQYRENAYNAGNASWNTAEKSSGIRRWNSIDEKPKPYPNLHQNVKH